MPASVDPNDIKCSSAWYIVLKRLPDGRSMLQPELLAVALSCWQRPRQNLRTQWEIDRASLIDGSLNEIRGFVDYLRRKRAQDPPKDPIAAHELGIFQDQLEGLLTDPDFRTSLEATWLEFSKDLSTDPD